MKIKVKEGHTGIMTLKDETQVNYGIIRITQNLSKITFYTGKGLRELFKPDMNEEERVNAAQLRKLDEKTLILDRDLNRLSFNHGALDAGDIVNRKASAFAEALSLNL